MNANPQELSLDTEEAIAFMVRGLREGDNRMAFQHCKIYIPHVLQAYLSSVTGRTVDANEATSRLPELGPFFYDGAWELCRRGILRPSHEPPRTVGAAGLLGPNYYLPTTSGLRWLEDATQYDLLLLEPGRMAKALAGFHQKFGDGYLERSQEAIRCYNALAFLGCCAMCGAAAESIALKLAVIREGDEDKVLRAYQSANGRKKIEDIILNQRTASTRRTFSGHMDLLKYWRDAAAHGERTGISEGEAFISLTQLYRLAIFGDQHWDDLTRP